MGAIISIIRFPFTWFSRQRRRNKVISIVVLIVVLGALTMFWRGRNGHPEYEVATPTRGAITEVVTETGNITTSSSVDVFSTSRGVVTEVYIDNGTAVESGNPLFHVVSSATQQERANTYASYAAAKSAYEAANAQKLALQAVMFSKWDAYFTLAEGDDYDDPEDAFRRNLPEFTVPDREWLAAEANYKNQSLVVAKAQADLNAAWLAYQATVDTTIVAPADGVIHNLSVSVGDTVDLKPAVSAAAAIRPVLIIAGQHETIMAADFNETDVTLIEAGQPARVDVDAIRQEEFDAEVVRVDTYGTDTQGVITYRVFVRLLETDPRMRPGMTGTVDVIVAQKDDVLTVPSSAVKPYQGGRAVRVYNAETREIEFVPVVVGSKGDDGNTEIVSGIDETTEVITALKNEQVERSGGSFGF